MEIDRKKMEKLLEVLLELLEKADSQTKKKIVPLLKQLDLEAIGKGLKQDKQQDSIKEQWVQVLRSKW